ncbi:hypothetical protein G9G54_13675 [Paenibacillus sp. EKM212P]|uniref:hypothetical protein n=1 Tax=Paenibacillus sp. EKM212P TaxID=1683680 RepID=UPI0013ECFA0C|nr:hypothetical protein [Paenibacillus sp. EKM212P]KAF6578321.1 hypothetical protein G9G54_13675 [Paenibacillus sp. EKM212P]
MTDKPERLISADKLLEWAEYETWELYCDLKAEIECNTFDPDPPQQPDIQVGERNWQEDMDKVNAYKHTQTLAHRPPGMELPTYGFKFESPFVPLEYWLQQYAALEREYERFQKAAMGWNDDLTAVEKAYEGLQANCVSRGEYEATLKKLDDMTKAYHALLQDKGDKL